MHFDIKNNSLGNGKKVAAARLDSVSKRQF